MQVLEQLIKRRSGYKQQGTGLKILSWYIPTEAMFEQGSSSLNRFQEVGFASHSRQIKTPPSTPFASSVPLHWGPVQGSDGVDGMMRSQHLTSHKLHTRCTIGNFK
jgi:hypothetical protein